MKKVLLLVAALFFVLSLSACDNKPRLECTEGSETLKIYYEDGEVTEINDSEEGDVSGADYDVIVMAIAMLPGETIEDRLEQFGDLMEIQGDTEGYDITCELK